MAPGILLLLAVLQDFFQAIPSAFPLILNGTRLYIIVLFVIHVLYRIKITPSLYLPKWLDPVLLLFLLVIAQEVYALLQGHSSVLHVLVLSLIIVIWNFIFNISCDHYSSFEKALSSPPLLVIKNGRPLKINMWWGDLNEEELAKRLEKQGISDISNSKKVFLQPDGTFVVLKE
jgi:uncharacterized membrane protein YcaP (DUF421 family)